MGGIIQPQIFQRAAYGVFHNVTRGVQWRLPGKFPGYSEETNLASGLLRREKNVCELRPCDHDRGNRPGHLRRHGRIGK